MSNESTGTRLRYSPSDYPFLTPGGGGEKLASSQVAPLVARARGNASVTAQVDHPGLPDRRYKQGKRLAASLANGDVLVMPWYSTEHVAAATAIEPDRIQYRPETPVADSEGHVAKYEFTLVKDPERNQIPIGCHPSTPPSWFLDAKRRLIIAEGQLKADALLTGILLDAGFDNELHVTPEMSCEDARLKLGRLMARVEDHPLVFEIAGSGNWHGSANERQLTVAKLKRRVVLVAMDADAASNIAVWRQAKQLFAFLAKRDAEPRLLSPQDPTSQDQKLGVDDYLAQYGTWADLQLLLRADLPEAPGGEDSALLGKPRVNVSMTGVEELAEVRRDGEPSRAILRDLGVPFGGRVVSTTVARSPHSSEVASGRVDLQLDRKTRHDSNEFTVEVELGWMDENTKEFTSGRVIGPSAILNYPPSQWHRCGAHIPQVLMLNPNWPLPDDKGRILLEAMKRHRAHQIQQRTSWARNGWVPVPGRSIPAFIIGDQIICDEGDEDRILSGVTQETLSTCSEFGVGELDDRDWDDEGYRAHVAGLIEKVMDLFVTTPVWYTPGMGLVLLAAGLRPAIPLRSQVTLGMVGAPASGKSLSASVVMSFWARRPSAWAPDSLPGSAKDSIAHMQANIHQSLIWTVDDLAPSSNRAKADQETSNVEDIIRAKYNGRGRGRAERDGNVREAKDPNPYSVLILTSENPLTNRSVLQRMWTLRFARDRMSEQHRIDELTSMYTDDTVFAELSQAMIKFLRWRAASKGSWPGLIKWLGQQQSHIARDAQELYAELHSQGVKMRASKMLADLLISIRVLQAMCRTVGLRQAVAPLKDACDEATWLLAESSQRNQENSTPRAMLKAIATALASGQAHLLNAMDPSSPPGDDTKLQARLGWGPRGDNQMAARGTQIGYYLIDGDHDDTPYVLLNRDGSFQVAMRSGGADVIGGYGLKSESAWEQFYAEPGLVYRGIKQRVSGGRTMNSSLVSAGQGNRLSGIPVTLSTLLEFAG